MRRARTLALLTLASVTTGFAWSPTAQVPVAASDNITHVLQVEYDKRWDNQRNAGSDLEFATIPVQVQVQEPHPGRGRGAANRTRSRTVVEERTFAFAGSYRNGLQIVDVSDPEASHVAAVYDCAIAQGDVQVWHREDLGRWFVAYARDNGYAAETRTASACFTEAVALGFADDVSQLGPGTFIVDVTDPYHPSLAAYVSFPKGSHNQTVHPSGRYLYNSNSELITSVAGSVGIEVADITDLSPAALADPANRAFLPLPIRPGLGTESHDITFNADGTRAYSAALSQTVIIDTTDPMAPAVISSIFDPAINVEHQSNPVTLTDPLLGTREFLIIEDEFVGAVGTGQCPNGGVHVYDITGDLERTPVKVGYWNIAEFGPTERVLGRCTAHVFELHPEEQIMLIAYYNAGVRVVDLSGLVGVALGQVGIGMRELAFMRFADSDTWAVKAPSVSRDDPFYIYGNDQVRGFDVYRVDLTDPAAASPDVGQWLTPAQALQRAANLPTAPTAYRTTCLLPQV